MLKRIMAPRGLPIVVAAAAAAVSIAVLSCGGDEKDADAKVPDRLELTIEGREQVVTLVNNPANRVGPRGSQVDQSKETPGDLAVQEAPVNDESGEQIGEMYSVFTTVGEPGTEMVTGTLVLEDGQIVGQGMIGQGREDLLAILGGTGDYDGARGTLRVTQRDERVNLVAEFTE